MGPWLCSHGNAAEKQGSGTCGAASMGPWLCSHGNVPHQRAGVSVTALQWGRGCVATEIIVRRVIIVRRDRASMGPWLCSHGNVDQSLHTPGVHQASMGPWLCSHGNVCQRKDIASAVGLQWGRGCVATEICSLHIAFTQNQ